MGHIGGAASFSQIWNSINVKLGYFGSFGITNDLYFWNLANANFIGSFVIKILKKIKAFLSAWNRYFHKKNQNDLHISS